MKPVLFIIFSLFILTTQSSAQDSIITYRNYTFELMSSSTKNLEGNYYKYQPIRLNEGDKIIVEYFSNDLLPELAIKDSLGDIVKKTDGERTPTNVNGKITFVFTAPYSMLYYLSFSTKLPNVTGRCGARLYYYNKHADTVNSNSSFCTKLNYIIANSRLNFEFLKSDKSAYLSEKYEPTIQLTKENTCIIAKTNNLTYNCTYLKTTDKGEADRIYTELQTNLNNCLEQYNKQSSGTTTAPEMIYKLEGNEMNDINALHTLMNVKGAVELKYKKVSGNYYINIVVL